jgi:hypothetical protein
VNVFAEKFGTRSFSIKVGLKYKYLPIKTERIPIIRNQVTL